MLMDLLEREVKVGQLHLAFIFAEHVLQQGLLHPTTERALKIREFHDRDRRIGVSLHPSLAVSSDR
jgi:hypothetical protein